MHRILIAGLPDRLAGWLAQRLRGVAVEVAYTGDDALAVLGEGVWAALVIDASVEGLPADRVIRYARAGTNARTLPVVLTVDPTAEGHDEEALRRMVSELRVDRILLAPLDRGELARHVGALIEAEAAADVGAPAPAPSAAPAAAIAEAAPAATVGAAGPPEAVSAALAAVWERAMPTIFARLDTVEKAVKSMLATGAVPRELREDAEREAHRLAGALGTFGSHEGTRLARAIESALAASAPGGRDVGGRVWQAVAALRREVESRAPAGTVPQPAPQPAPAAPVSAPASVSTTGSGPRVAVLSDDAELLRAVGVEAARRGMRASGTGLGAAAAALDGERPDAILLDVGAGDEDGAGWALLPIISRRHPGVPLLVSAGRDSLLDRVRVLQLGARLFLEKPFTAAEALDAVQRLAPRAAAPGGTRVLAVDDDPQILAAVRALLEPQQLAVHTLDSPLRFWNTLRETRPDLLILDVDMPYLDGIELCRVVRSDHRWSTLPILFLTARTDAQTILRVFAAGADDYVTKPVVGPELIARLRNRLDRLAPRRDG